MISFMADRTSSVIVDSSVWVGYFDELDSNHKKAKILMAVASAGTIIVTEYVLLEVASVLKRKIGQRKTRDIIDMILRLENVNILESHYFFHKTLKLFLLLEEKHLSFVDVSLVVLSKDFEVVTLDTKLAKMLY